MKSIVRTFPRMSCLAPLVTMALTTGCSLLGGKSGLSRPTSTTSSETRGAPATTSTASGETAKNDSARGQTRGEVSGGPGEATRGGGTKEATSEPVKCAPSCYSIEPAAPAAGKEVKACMHQTKGFCQDATTAGWGPANLNAGVTFVEIVDSCKFPAPKSGKWATLSKNAVGQYGSVKPGDVVFIPSSEEWYTAESDNATSRCVDLHWYEKEASVTLNVCGGTGSTFVCERSGSRAALGFNMLHARLDEAKRLKAAEDVAGCKIAARQAIAFSRGLPRFKKNLGGDWAQGLTYKTRADGTLKEKELFAKAAKLGAEAESVFASCGGEKKVATDEKEELGFTGLKFAEVGR